MVIPGFWKPCTRKVFRLWKNRNWIN
jgi:hypothetical protein